MTSEQCLAQLNYCSLSRRNLLHVVSQVKTRIMSVVNKLNHVNFKKGYFGNIRIVKRAVTENGLQNLVYNFKPDYTLQQL